MGKIQAHFWPRMLKFLRQNGLVKRFFIRKHHTEGFFSTKMPYKVSYFRDLLDFLGSYPIRFSESLFSGKIRGKFTQLCPCFGARRSLSLNPIVLPIVPCTQFKGSPDCSMFICFRISENHLHWAEYAS